MSLLKSLLAHPLTRGADLDDPRTTALRRRIVREKKFLRRIYEEWYEIIGRSLPPGDVPVLELGSGAGFMDEFIPGLITSEIFHCPGVRVVLDGQQLPFPDASLRAIVMTDVLHHLPNVRAFFSEASRCVHGGGVISMIEPWMSGWSKLIYRKLHHEPVLTETREWEFPASGPLSGANVALPWIVFMRDREIFEREFPGWRIETIAPMMPLRYLLSGGVSMRSLLPGWSTPLAVGAEAMLQPIIGQTAMFAHIVLRRVGASPASPSPRRVWKMPLPKQTTDRSAHELAHGRHLFEAGAEDVWGWGTPAGKLRAARRGQLIAQTAGLKPGMRVLEVGCGTGLFTEIFARSGAHIIANDISPELLEVARARGLDPKQVEFIAGRFEDSALLGPFDAVVGSSVLHHLEVEPSLAKIRELLKSGGTMAFAEPNMLNPQIAIQKNIPWIKRLLGDSPDETAFVRWSLRRKLERAGFVDITIKPFDWLHPATPRAIIPVVRAFGAGLERIPLAREFAGSVLCHAKVP